MFYKINDNNEIISFSKYKVDDSYIETNKNIVDGFDHKYYFEEEIKTKEYADKLKTYELKINNQNKIAELKQKLADTDYLAIKFAEGELTVEEYVKTKAQRKLWREEINSLEV